jgi:hypothetical protein
MALPLIVLLGGIPSLTDVGIVYVAVYLTTSALLLLLVISPFRMWLDQRRVDARRVLEISLLKEQILLLSRPADHPSMSLRALAAHLHARVKRFAEISDYGERYKAVDITVRDALSLRHIEATGCPKDWINEMLDHHTTRTEIGTEFWKKEGSLDWASVAHDDAYERATAVDEHGGIVFYDVEFDTAAVAKKWPADYSKELGFLELAEVAEGCLGFDFTSRASHNLSFIHGVRQAARLGHLKMLGRAKAYAAQKRFAGNYPLEPIMAGHFSEWSIVVPGCELRSGDDWDIITSKPDANRDECYRDLHFADRHEALTWLLSFTPVRLEASDETIWTSPTSLRERQSPPSTE